MDVHRVLIVDDDPVFSRTTTITLERAGVAATSAADLATARSALLAAAPACILLDVNLGLDNGLALLDDLETDDNPPAVVMLTGATSTTLAQEAIRHGAAAYLVKPVSGDQLLVAIHAALEDRRLRRENRNLRCVLRRETAAAGAVVAASPAMRALLQEARDAAAIDAPILIEGETGVGKEVVAQYIHRLSARRDGPFTPVNCGALPETLVDDEFFGHEAGAFTGAHDARPGLIEVSDGGTLLLDEIGDITPAAQVRLLRVLEQGMVRRIGARRERRVDVRILAATHRDLEEAVAAGSFRADLFHRLVVLRLHLPPLRERPEDIVPLAEYLLDQLGCRHGGPGIGLGEDTHDLLRRAPWPGNVRELRNVIERAWFNAHRDRTAMIHARHLRCLTDPTRSSSTLPIPTSGSWPLRDEHGRIMPLQTVEQRQLAAVVAESAGRREAAAHLGISERSLYRRLRSP